MTVAWRGRTLRRKLIFYSPCRILLFLLIKIKKKQRPILRAGGSSQAFTRDTELDGSR